MDEDYDKEADLLKGVLIDKLLVILDGHKSAGVFNNL